jgi:hypothetical protein
MNALVAMVKRAFEPHEQSEESRKLESTLEWCERTSIDLELAINRLDTALMDLHPEREHEQHEDAA